MSLFDELYDMGDYGASFGQSSGILPGEMDWMGNQGDPAAHQFLRGQIQPFPGYSQGGQGYSHGGQMSPRQSYMPQMAAMAQGQPAQGQPSTMLDTWGYGQYYQPYGNYQPQMPYQMVPTEYLQPNEQQAGIMPGLEEWQQAVNTRSLDTIQNTWGQLDPEVQAAINQMDTSYGVQPMTAHFPGRYTGGERELVDQYASMFDPQDFLGL